MVKIFVIGRVLSSVMVACWYFTGCLTTVRPAGPAVIPRFMLLGGARGQYLGYHRFCLMSWRLVMDEYFTWDVGSVWHKHWPEFIYIGQWPIFHGLVILLYILKTICWTNAIIGILIPCDAKIYVIKSMWVSDLHFMVQWFCLVSWKLFDGLILYLRYWFSVTTETIYLGRWPIFHGPVILPYILKTIWWTDVIIGILDPCDAKIYQKKYMWVSDLHFIFQ